MKNILITALVIGLIALVGYMFSQKQTSSVTTEDNAMPIMENSDMDEMMMFEEEEGEAEMDMSGIHIMADGTVMLGNGTVVTDAVINADGTISMPDGQVVTPLMDMRQ